jgi:hypothetical protein
VIKVPAAAAASHGGTPEEWHTLGDVTAKHVSLCRKATELHIHSPPLEAASIKLNASTLDG